MSEMKVIYFKGKEFTPLDSRPAAVLHAMNKTLSFLPYNLRTMLQIRNELLAPGDPSKHTVCETVTEEIAEYAWEKFYANFEAEFENRKEED